MTKLLLIFSIIVIITTGCTTINHPLKECQEDYNILTKNNGPIVPIVDIIQIPEDDILDYCKLDRNLDDDLELRGCITKVENGHIIYYVDWWGLAHEACHMALGEDHHIYY